jgi:DNA ligase 1
MMFTDVASYFQNIEQESSRLLITKIVAELFNKVSSEEITAVCYLLIGRVGPLFDSKEFGMSDKFLVKAIARSMDIPMETVQDQFRKSGDLGTAAELLAQSQVREQKKPIGVLEVFSQLRAIQDIAGDGSQEKKIDAFASLLRCLDPQSLRFVVRIPLGKLRLGLSDMTILDGLSWMLTGDKTHRVELEAAYSVRPDIGSLAGIIKQYGVQGIKKIDVELGVPILPCLCQRVPTFVEMIEKMGEVLVEPKYDGVRVQIHFSQERVDTFSRNLETTTPMFPELADMKQHVSVQSCILDCEAVGVHPVTGDILPFQETTTRRRKHDIQEALEQVPLRFYVFDMVYKNGKSLLNTPLTERKKMLTEAILPNELLVLSPSIVTQDPEEIRSYHELQRQKGLEGIVVKKSLSAYEPGRKGYTWVKLKEEEGTQGKLSDTVDAVVMGYYRGEGKRTAFGMGAFLVGVRSDDQFMTVCKIGTGISDEMLEMLRIRLDALKSNLKPTRYVVNSPLLVPDVWVNPNVVVEIAGDDLTKSPTHSAGYAVRFPRLIRIREDKSPDQATTLEEIKQMFINQL